MRNLRGSLPLLLGAVAAVAGVSVFVTYETLKPPASGQGAAAATVPPAPAKPATLADALSPAAVLQDKAQIAAAALPAADKSTPFSQYKSLQSGNQIMFYFYAISGMPIDYDTAAQDFSSDYRSTSDSFRKNDLLTALRPRIDADVAQARLQRYFFMTTPAQLQPYNFAHKAFNVSSGLFDSGSYRYFNDNSKYKISFTNGSEFGELKPMSEDVARQIEKLRSSYTPMTMDVFAFVQSADAGSDTINAQIVSVQLKDRDGGEIASFR